MYAHEDYLDNPPTVEKVRFGTLQYLRTRGSYREKAPYGQQNQNRQPPAPQMPQRQVVPQPNVLPQGNNNALHQNRQRQTQMLSITDPALHLNSLVTLPENVLTGITRRCISQRISKSTR